MVVAEREPDDLEDEALRWEGDDERGLAAPEQRRKARRARDGAADGADAADDGTGEADGATDAAGAATADGADAEPASASALVLLITGVFAGATLLSMLGWFTVVSASAVSFDDIVSEVMYQFGEFLAIAGPAIWFGAVLVLGRSASAARRLPWHLLGLLLTAPWPLLAGVA